jgi:hypothetical protein
MLLSEEYWSTETVIWRVFFADGEIGEYRHIACRIIPMRRQCTATLDRQCETYNGEMVIIEVKVSCSLPEMNRKRRRYHEMPCRGKFYESVQYFSV